MNILAITFLIFMCTSNTSQNNDSKNNNIINSKDIPWTEDITQTNLESSKNCDDSLCTKNMVTNLNPWEEKEEKDSPKDGNSPWYDYETIKPRYNPWGQVNDDSSGNNIGSWVDETASKETIYVSDAIEPKSKEELIQGVWTSDPSNSTKSSRRNKIGIKKRKIIPTVDELMCHLKDMKLVEARFGNETHFLCLKLRPIGLSPLVTNESLLLFEPDTPKAVDYGDDNDIFTEQLPIGHFTMAYGYPMENPESGSAEGYIGDDHQFYGVLHIGNRTLHADPYGRDNPRRFFGAFEHDNMVAPPRRRRDHETTQIGGVKYPKYFPFTIEEPRRAAATTRARICDLLLLADKEFYEKDANASLTKVVQRMMHAVTQADIIFRNADFNEDGVPDNIGFTVKYILVLTSEETNRRVFGNLLDKEAIDGREYLMKFARLRRLSEVCLGVAFSGHAFHNRTLGLSFTSLGGGLGGAAGGLCDRRAYGRSFNTLAIAHATTADAERVPERIAALTLAHEMGHSFGAHHDDNFPLPECRDHLMGSQSTSADIANHTEFSLCSKRLIATTLYSMSYCFTEDDSPFCGNGIVEAGEACDCGLPSRCSIRDPCCTPRAGGILFYETGTTYKEGCSVAPSADCHPSQGLCCNSNCRYANLSRSGIDCRTQNLECYCNDPRLCRCGLRGRCMEDWTCHAAECALLGLRECQCTDSPGGEIGGSSMCGVCCLLPNRAEQSEQCVGAEYAARDYSLRQRLPPDWPGDDMSGPNVTIRTCFSCREIQLRAWPTGSICVSRGVVGVCSPLGICRKTQEMPRSNLFPNVMRVKMQLKSKLRKSCTSLLRPSVFIVLLSMLFIL